MSGKDLKDDEIVQVVQEGTEKILRNGITFAKVKCTGCGEIKLRRTIGSNRHRKIHTDEKHKRWYGRKCPQCVRTTQRALMRAVRNSKLGEAECLNCGVKFEKVRSHSTYCSPRCRSLIRSKK